MMGAPSNEGAPIMEVRGVTKYFEHVRAVRDVDLAIRAGECLGLVGDNGAGKTTLIRILSGQLVPDRGELRIRGTLMEGWSVLTARAHGIATVAQDLALCDDLDVSGNVFLNAELLKWRLGPLGWMDRTRMAAASSRLLEEVGASVPNVSSTTELLSGGQRQAIAIARALRGYPALLLLDEPTAALGVRQSQIVLASIRNLVDDGIGVILISHNLEHVLSVADRVVAMFQGTLTLDAKASAVPRETVLSAMMGSR